MLQSKLGSPFLAPSTAFPPGLREGQRASEDLHRSQYVHSSFSPYSGKVEESPERGSFRFFLRLFLPLMKYLKFFVVWRLNYLAIHRQGLEDLFPV